MRRTHPNLLALLVDFCKETKPLVGTDSRRQRRTQYCAQMQADGDQNQPQRPQKHRCEEKCGAGGEQVAAWLSLSWRSNGGGKQGSMPLYQCAESEELETVALYSAARAATCEVSLVVFRPSPFFELRRSRSQSSRLNDRYLIIHDFFNRPRSTLAPKPGFQTVFPAPAGTPPFLSMRCIATRTDSSQPQDDENAAHDAHTTFQGAEPTSTPMEAKKPPDQHIGGTGYTLDNYPAFIRRLSGSLPHIHFQRPTKEELLNVTSGFWERLRIRFKWFTIRSFRKFNSDDFSAFLSWLVVGNAVWIVIGTYVQASLCDNCSLTPPRTTFAAAVLATFNSLQMQGSQDPPMFHKVLC